MGTDELPHYATMIDSKSPDELRLALLRAIDHARRSSAEVSHFKAQLDGSLGTIDALREEIESLKLQLREVTSPDSHP